MIGLMFLNYNFGYRAENRLYLGKLSKQGDL